MNAEDLERFAEDLKTFAHIETAVEPDPNPDGLHVLRIGKVDFFFNADGSGYDGWGMCIGSPKKNA